MSARRTLVGLVVVLLASASLLVLVEAAARLVFGAGEPRRLLAERSHTRYDPELGWVSRPGLSLPDFYGPGASLHTDARGFRDERPPGLAPDRMGVVCSGDSFTLGYGVDDGETWCRQLERIDPRLRTVNLGQGGYGVDQSYLWYRRDGAQLDHALHLFAFIVEDFARMEAVAFFGYGKPRLRLEGEGLAVENVPVPRGAYRVARLARALGGLPRLRSVELLRAWAGVRADTMARYAHLPRAEVLVPRVFAELARIDARAGRLLVLVHLPMREEYDDRGSDVWRGFLAEQALALGISFFDLVEELRALPPEAARRLFIPEGAIDFPGAAGHYSVTGNRTVAGWIHARLARVPGYRRRLSAGAGQSSESSRRISPRSGPAGVVVSRTK